jgi:hypothetical protein
VAEARALLRDVGHWILLSSCDHDGVVSAYRTLKGLVDLGQRRLSVAAVDAAEPAQADRVFQKLASVCAQFISWTLEPEPAIGAADQVGECQVMCCRASHDKAQLAAAPHWQVVAELVQEAKSHVEEEPAAALPQPDAPAVSVAAETSQPAPESPAAKAPQAPCPEAASVPVMEPIMSPPAAWAPPLPEVVDLPDGSSQESIISAVIRHSLNELVECPVRPPMCPEARLGVSRDRRIILMAVAGHGLSALKSIGRAYQWVLDNRALLAMALPQFALDAHQVPHLRLLVDQSDLSAKALEPMLQSNTISIHTYKQVRWGERTAVLLDAA